MTKNRNTYKLKLKVRHNKSDANAKLPLNKMITCGNSRVCLRILLKALNTKPIKIVVR